MLVDLPPAAIQNKRQPATGTRPMAGMTPQPVAMQAEVPPQTSPPAEFVVMRITGRGPYVLFALAVTLGGAALCSVASAQPALSHALPGALAPGKTTEVTLHGAKLDQPLRLWTSFPAQVELVPGDPNQKGKGQLGAKITLSAGVPVGIGGVAVATAEGVSDVLFIAIDDLPSATDNGNNHDLPTAQEIALPIAIDGACDGTTFDYYRFAAKGGQRISCEVMATRLGWDFDSVIRILDAGGQEVFRSDDDPSTAADSRFVFVAPRDGQYVLELRDNRYKPGGRYRLRLGDFPLVSVAYPPAVQRGVYSTISFAGPLTDGIGPLNLLAPLDDQPLTPVTLRGPSSQASSSALLQLTDLPVVVESAPADKPDEATAVTVPAAICGRLETSRDRDLFQFTAARGTPVSFRAVTRSLNSPAIVMLRLLNAAGNQLAESPVMDTDEPTLNFAIPEDGTYKLSVEELAGRGGADYAYLVESRTGPQLTLLLKNDPNQNRIRHSLAGNGGAFHLDVQCQRHGFDGPVTLHVDSPRLGWQVFNNVIPKGAAEGRIYVIVPPDFADAELASLTIVGRADETAKGCQATMMTTVQLRTARPQTAYPPAWLDGMIFVSGYAPHASFYNVTADRLEVNYPRLVGQTQFTLKFDRTNPNFKDVPLTVLPLGLPAGIAAEVKRNGNGPSETYDIILKGPKDLAEGQHSIRYFTFAEFGPTNGRAVHSGDIRLNVTTPLAVTAAPAGPLVVGQKQKVKLTLTRRGDDKQPVDLKFKALPPGVTAPDKTTLAPDQNEVEVELTAAADAQPVKFDQLVAVATTKYAGTDITLESPAVSLEVKTP